MILVFGTICLDRLRRVPAMPPPGGYVEVESEEWMLGGEAANTANALTAWGAEIILAGNGLGSGPEARLLEEELRSHGLAPVAGHLTPISVTPICDVFVSHEGIRTMIGSGFSAMGASVDPSKLPFRDGDWFTVEPNMPEESRQAANLAYERGMKIYAMDFVADEDPVLPGTFWQSSTDWAGLKGDREGNLRWIRGWIAKTRCFAILTDGANGFVAGSPEIPPRHYPGFPVGKAVDTTGAGDLFRAGMLYGLDKAWSIPKCLRFAAAAGSLACRYPGATTVVPTIAEIDALIGECSAVALAYDD